MRVCAEVDYPIQEEVQESPARFSVLGVNFCAMQIPDVICQMKAWISARDRARYVCVSNVHSVVESQHSDSFKATLNESDLNLPDGMPIVWLGRLQGHDLPRRVYGPELFEQFFHQTQEDGYRHFFYGGSQETLDALARELKAKFPRMRIAGSYSPPFRPLNLEEKSQIVQTIADASPDLVWVGLGCPKQELWMKDCCSALNVPVLVGVGQAFNIYAGRVRQAPRWMREHGLEWLFRLCSEPRRLWKRYLVYNTYFLCSLLLESVGLRSFE